MKLDQPTWPRLLPTRTVLAIATLGPVGRRLQAPGTWGSAAGLLYFTVFFHGLGAAANLALTAVGAYLAVGICGEAEARLRRKDPGEVILDEFVAMPLCYLGYQSLLFHAPAWLVLLLGFGLFRFFDVLKPLGIARLQDLPGGWGVVADDIAAALAACLTLHAGLWFWFASQTG